MTMQVRPAPNTITNVWKYPISLMVMQNRVLIPDHAELLRFGTQAPDEQGTHTFLWARVDPDRPKIARVFCVVGTGHPIPPLAVYVGSCSDGPFEWHLFEIP